MDQRPEQVRHRLTDKLGKCCKREFQQRPGETRPEDKMEGVA